jgi:serine/threonine protein kinase
MEPGRVLAGRFEIRELAGRGGMGAVYRARDRQTGAEVAVKVMLGADDTEAARFVREARVLAELEHPAIVRYVDHGAEPDGELYLAMEWLAGEDLAKRLARGKLSIAQSVGLMQQLAEGLARAHERGVIHRDIKPSNVFLLGGDPGRPRLLDFGVARIEANVLVITGSTEILGTAGYMAPEQIDGSRNVDTSSDVFSLGCVLFECLTGERAFPGDHMLAVMAKVVCHAVPPVREIEPDVPPAVEDLLARMLSKEREGRPRNAGALFAELSALADLAPVPPEVYERVTHAPPEVLGFLAVALVEGDPASQSMDVTLAPTAVARKRAMVWAIVSKYGGDFARLANGSLVVTVAGDGDRAALCERTLGCALALREAFPRARMALSLGKDSGHSGALVVAETIDRAAELLAGEDTATMQRAILLDAQSAKALGERDELRGPGAFRVV